MDQHVGVGVAEQAEGVRDGHPAKNERTVGDQAVGVVAVTDGDRAGTTRLPGGGLTRFRVRYYDTGTGMKGPG